MVQRTWAAFSSMAGRTGRCCALPMFIPHGKQTAGLSFFACHHLTPELLRTPAWLSHPNGALGIRSVTWMVPDPVPVVAVLARVFGSSAVTWTDDVAAVHAGRATLLFAKTGDLGMLHPGLSMADDPPAPTPVAMALRVASADRAARFLDLQGVPHQRDAAGGITVAPSEACGVLVEFAEA